MNNFNNLDFYMEHTPEIQIKALYNTNMHNKINKKYIKSYMSHYSEFNVHLFLLFFILNK